MNRASRVNRSHHVLAVAVVALGLGGPVEALSGTVTVNSGGSLNGTGIIDANIVVESGGQIAAGNDGTTGCLQVTSLELRQGSQIEATIGGTVPCIQHDQLQVVTLPSNPLASVMASAINGYVPALGDEITLISIGAGKAASPFSNGIYPQETVLVAGIALSIEGIGGDGNDIALRYRSVPSDPALISVVSDDEGEITIEFDVANSGASALTSTAVTCSDGNQSFQGQVIGQTGTVSGLNPDLSYTCTVTATNSNGASQSVSSVALMPATLSSGLPIWLLYEASRQVQ